SSLGTTLRSFLAAGRTWRRDAVPRAVKPAAQPSPLRSEPEDEALWLNPEIDVTRLAKLQVGHISSDWGTPHMVRPTTVRGHLVSRLNRFEDPLLPGVTLLLV